MKLITIKMYKEGLSPIKITLCHIKTTATEMQGIPQLHKFQSVGFMI